MKFLLKKVCLITLLSILHLFCMKPQATAIVQTPPAINYGNIISSECRFILAHQLSDGAFIMSANRDVAGYRIVPYFNNIAARALLENPSPANIAAVRRWMSWY